MCATVARKTCLLWSIWVFMETNLCQDQSFECERKGPKNPSQLSVGQRVKLGLKKKGHCPGPYSNLVFRRGLKPTTGTGASL